MRCGNAKYGAKRVPVVETSEALDRMDTVEERRADSDPERRSQELKQRIRQVLAGLTPRERAVFEMRHYCICTATTWRSHGHVGGSR